jgi:hypothetical protein
MFLGARTQFLLLITLREAIEHMNILIDEESLTNGSSEGFIN